LFLAPCLVLSPAFEPLLLLLTQCLLLALSIESGLNLSLLSGRAVRLPLLPFLSRGRFAPGVW
jgi:hypothetical protein